MSSFQTIFNLLVMKFEQNVILLAKANINILFKYEMGMRFSFMNKDEQI